MERITPVKSLQEFFKNSVAAAMQRQQLAADDHTAFYVVNLLTLFARSEALFDDTEDGRQLRPVARVLAEAVAAERPAERQHALKRVGDVSLFVAGFLGEGLKRKLVGIDYYVQMGGSAYGVLADHVRGSLRGDVYSSVFAELAEKFQDFVDVLAEVRGEALGSQNDLLHLYEQWMVTGSKRAARLLRARGLEPVPAGTASMRH